MVSGCNRNINIVSKPEKVNGKTAKRRPAFVPLDYKLEESAVPFCPALIFERKN